jgi:hypothetical protein
VAIRRLWVRTLIDSVHALSAGVTPGAAVVLWMVRSGAQTTLDPVTFADLTRTWTPVLLVPAIAVLLLVATGLARLSHRTAHVAPAAIGPRARATLVEHAVFVVLLTGATILIFTLVQT